MRQRRVFPRMSLFAAGMIPLALAAATYKWIDERGVVNYGNAPPAAARQVKQFDEEASRVSTIPAVPRAQLEREKERLLRARVARLEQEIDELRRARAAAPAPTRAFDRYYAFPQAVAVYAPAYAFPVHRSRFRAEHCPVHAPFRGGVTVRVTAGRR